MSASATVSVPVISSATVTAVTATAHPGECGGDGTQVPPKQQGPRVDGFSTSFARVAVLEPRGERAARVERLSSDLHVQYLVALGTCDVRENLLKCTPPIMCGQQSVHIAVEEFVDVSDGRTVGDERVRPLMRGKQLVHVAVEAFSA